MGLPCLSDEARTRAGSSTVAELTKDESGDWRSLQGLRHRERDFGDGEAGPRIGGLAHVEAVAADDPLGALHQLRQRHLAHHGRGSRRAVDRQRSLPHPARPATGLQPA